MSTLDAFLARGKKIHTSPTQIVNVKHAFVNPYTAVVRKPAPSLKASPKPVKNQAKTIAQYFTPANVDTDVEMEEPPADICVIRRKIPVMDFWETMQHEFDQDPFYTKDFEQKDALTITRKAPITTISTGNSNRRRPRQDDVDHNATRKKHKKTDNELSSIMARFLNMGTAIKYRPTNLDFMNEFSEETEDLSRKVRHKKTLQESHLFVYNITQEFLY